MENPMTNAWDVLVAVVYVLGAAVVMLVLRTPLSSLLKKNTVKITLPGGLSEIEISPADAGGKISAILNEFKDRYESLLNDYQKDAYRRIVREDSPVRVVDLIPGFDRSNPEHIGALRALRGIGLVVPETGGSWNGDSHVVITRFGRAINDFLKESV